MLADGAPLVSPQGIPSTDDSTRRGAPMATPSLATDGGGGFIGRERHLDGNGRNAVHDDCQLSRLTAGLGLPLKSHGIGSPECN